MTRTHGLSHKHPLYERWCAMHARCTRPTHPSYHRYGARGISVCDRWTGMDGFPAFVADVEPMWPRGSWELHRIDNDGNYEPDNCTWLPKSAHMALPKSEQHRRAIGEAHRGRVKSPQEIRNQADAQRAKLDPEELRAMYVGRGMSIYAIADATGYGKSSVARALKRLKIGRSGRAAGIAS